MKKRLMSYTNLKVVTTFAMVLSNLTMTSAPEVKMT